MNEEWTMNWSERFLIKLQAICNLHLMYITCLRITDGVCRRQQLRQDESYWSKYLINTEFLWFALCCGWWSGVSLSPLERKREREKKNYVAPLGRFPEGRKGTGLAEVAKHIHEANRLLVQRCKLQAIDVKLFWSNNLYSIYRLPYCEPTL